MEQRLLLYMYELIKNSVWTWIEGLTSLSELSVWQSRGTSCATVLPMLGYTYENILKVKRWILPHNRHKPRNTVNIRLDTRFMWLRTILMIELEQNRLVYRVQIIRRPGSKKGWNKTWNCDGFDRWKRVLVMHFLIHEQTKSIIFMAIGRNFTVVILNRWNELRAYDNGTSSVEGHHCTHCVTNYKEAARAETFVAL